MLITSTNRVDSYAKLCLPGVAAVGSTAITDVSAAARTISNVGGVAVAAAPGPHPYAPAAGYFDGASTLGIPDDAAWAFGSGDFCIRFWMYKERTPSYCDIIVSQSSGSGNGDPQWNVNMGTNDRLCFSEYSSASVPASQAIANNVWTHVVIARSAGSLRFFINGVKDSQTAYAGVVPDRAYSLVIGGGRDQVGNASFYKGWLCDLLIDAGPGACAAYAGDTCPVPAGPEAATALTALHLPMMSAKDQPALDSATGRAITPSAGLALKQLSRFPTANAAGLFNGSTDYLSLPDHPDWTLGASDFTLELFARYSAASSGTSCFMSHWDGGMDQRGWLWWHDSSTNTLYLYASSNGATVVTVGWSWTPAAGKVYHLACVRASGSVSMYVNGVRLGSAQTLSVNIFNAAAELRIGSYNNPASACFPGLLAEARISSVARYTTGFAPPTAQFVPDASTLLLVHMDRAAPATATQFIDQSPAARAVTAVSGARQIVCQPALDTVVDAYADGSGAFLKAAAGADLDMGTAPFTVEGWWYQPTSRLGANYIGPCDWGQGGWMLFANGADGRLSFQAAGANLFAFSVSPPVGRWFHMAVTRDASNTARLFIDGVERDAVVSTASLSSGGMALGVCGCPTATGHLAYAYTGWAHVVSGTCLYAASFAPPPLPSKCAGSRLLLLPGAAPRFFPDKSAVLVPKAATPTGSAAQRFIPGAGRSIGFNGTSQHLTVPGHADFDITEGGRDFTVDMWLNIASYANNPRIVCCGDYNGGVNGWWIYVQTNGFGFNAYAAGSSSNNVFSWTAPATSRWFHLAVVRASGVLTGYVDGVAVSSWANTFSAATGAATPLQIGRTNNATYYYNGQLAGLRISKGIARWTGNFTVPSRPS